MLPYIVEKVWLFSLSLRTDEGALKHGHDPDQQMCLKFPEPEEEKPWWTASQLLRETVGS